jgi:hypothetical protein
LPGFIVESVSGLGVSVDAPGSGNCAQAALAPNPAASPAIAINVEICFRNAATFNSSCQYVQRYAPILQPSIAV